MSEMSASPAISVIIPTYNRAGTIERTIESVLKQTFKDFELLVIDDGSSDGTSEVVESCEDDRVNLFRLDTRGGAAAARNVGIGLAKGRYVSFIDSDDQWSKDKLLSDFNILENDTGCVITSPEVAYVDEKSGKVIERQASKKSRVTQSMVLRTDCSTTIDFTVPRDVILQVGGFDERLPARQDWDLWIRITAIGYGIQDPTGTSIHNIKGAEQISSGLKRKRDGTIILMEKHKSLFKSDTVAYRRILNNIALMYILDEDRSALEFLERSYSLPSSRWKKIKLALILCFMKVMGERGIRWLKRYFTVLHPHDYLLW
jgi:glycosyltransferase involved in cell wall biosynthesis